MEQQRSLLVETENWQYCQVHPRQSSWREHVLKIVPFLIRTCTDHVLLYSARGQQLCNCVTVFTFELDQGHVTRNQPVTVLVLLTESLGICCS